MNLYDLSLMLLRALIVYVALLLVLRLLPRRALSRFQALDLVLVLLIGQIVVAPLLGEFPLLPALVLLGLFIVLHWLNSYLSCRWSWFDHFRGGTPVVLVSDGVLNRRAMTAEHISQEELAALLREQDVELLSEVKLATLERDGRLTVIRAAGARELCKGDLEPLLQYLSEHDQQSL